MRFQDRYQIPSNRLPGWDYAAPGMYFVTVCTKDMKCYFGKVADGKMLLNGLGEIVKEEILKTPGLRNNIEIDSWVIMPNHLHLIIINSEDVETPRRGVSTEPIKSWKPVCLGSIINHLKGSCTKRIRANYLPAFSWQARFYDHIIRSETDRDNLRLYIQLNPQNWRLENSPVNFDEAFSYA